MIDLPLITRECGECTACCKTHIGTEMKTRGGDYCDHCQIGQGCSIYEQRPVACQVYRCVWVCGKGEEGYRPDRLGVVVDLKGIEFLDEEIVAINFWEVEKGATKKPQVEAWMISNIEGGNIVVCRPYGEEPTYYFPKDMLLPEQQQELIEALENDPGPLLRP